MSLPQLNDEKKRLASLRKLQILDPPAEPAYDDLAQLAAFVCEVPIALITLLDEDRQWFKARIGLTLRETPRSVSFCGHAIHNDGLFIVQDTHKDERFRQSPVVTGDPHIRFYAGMPVSDPDGLPVGTICVLDRNPRTLSPQQEVTLRVLARQVEAQFRIRQQIMDLQESRARHAQAELRLRENELRLKAANGKLQELARTDSLTGIQNRRAFDDALRRAWKLSSRIQRSLSLLMIDVDRFKTINDELGHEAGDHVMQIISQTFIENIRFTDQVFRYGGDEFTVLLPATDMDTGLQLAKKLNQAVAKQQFHDHPLSVSIGLAAAMADQAGKQECPLISAADAALYRAKQAGRNRVEVAHPNLTAQASSTVSQQE